MALFIVSMALTGAALATRFRVLILVPAIALTFAANVAAGIARGDSTSAILTATVIAAIALQVGYLCTIVAQYATGAARAHGAHTIQARSLR